MKPSPLDRNYALALKACGRGQAVLECVDDDGLEHMVSGFHYVGTSMMAGRAFEVVDEVGVKAIYAASRFKVKFRRKP